MLVVGVWFWVVSKLFGKRWWLKKLYQIVSTCQCNAEVASSDSPPDLLTTNVSRKVIDRHCNGCKVEVQSGRARNASQLHLVDGQIRQARTEINGIGIGLENKEELGESSKVIVDTMSEGLDQYNLSRSVDIQMTLIKLV